MAILKHISSRNSSYVATIKYLSYMHDEFKNEPILGHSPRVNQENYTKADNEFIRRSTEKYRKINGSEDFEQVTKGDQTIINFSSIRKKLQTQQLC